jgi:hypothetical protein
LHPTRSWRQAQSARETLEKPTWSKPIAKHQEILQELIKGITCIIPMKIGGEVPLNTTNNHKQKKKLEKKP